MRNDWIILLAGGLLAAVIGILLFLGDDYRDWTPVTAEVSHVTTASSSATRSA